MGLSLLEQIRAFILSMTTKSTFLHQTNNKTLLLNFYQLDGNERKLLVKKEESVTSNEDTIDFYEC